MTSTTSRSTSASPLPAAAFALLLLLAALPLAPSAAADPVSVAVLPALTLAQTVDSPTPAQDVPETCDPARVLCVGPFTVPPLGPDTPAVTVEVTTAELRVDATPHTEVDTIGPVRRDVVVPGVTTIPVTICANPCPAPVPPEGGLTWSVTVSVTTGDTETTVTQPVDLAYGDAIAFVEGTFAKADETDAACDAPVLTCTLTTRYVAYNTKGGAWVSSTDRDAVFVGANLSESAGDTLGIEEGPAASHRVRLCVSADPLRTVRCPDDADSDDWGTLQESVACTDPTDPSDNPENTAPAPDGCFPYHRVVVAKVFTSAVVADALP